MKELLELFVVILAGIAELVADVLLEAALAEFAGFLSRAIRHVRVKALRVDRFVRVKFGRADPVVATATFGLVGIWFGFLSVWLFPHHLVPPTGVHGISLLISPVLTGLLMAQIGRAMRRWGRQSVRIESFGYGFIFALALGWVRFWLVH